MTEVIHPGHAAVNLYHQYATYRGLQLEKRATAAELRKRAKAAPLKVDAVALRKQAKPLSDEADNAGSAAGKALQQFLQKAQEAQHVLTARMPPEWQAWDVTKTRAYTNALQILTVQLTRVHPKPEVVANAIQHLLGHSAWHASTLQILIAASPTSKTLPLH